MSCFTPCDTAGITNTMTYFYKGNPQTLAKYHCSEKSRKKSKKCDNDCIPFGQIQKHAKEGARLIGSEPIGYVRCESTPNHQYKGQYAGVYTSVHNPSA